MQPLALPEPEAINCKPRKMVGLWSQLTTAQRGKVLAYDGPENHADLAAVPKR